MQELNIFTDNFLETPLLAIKRNFHNNYYFMVGWFLFSYMLVLIIAYPVLNVLSRNKISRIVLLIFSLIIGYISIEYLAPFYKESKRFEINILIQVSVGSMFLYLGFLAKECIWKMLNPMIGYILFLIFVYLIQSKILNTTIIMSWSKFPGGLLLTLTSAMIGIYLVFLFSAMLAKYGNYFIPKVIGRNSKSIMSFHLLAFTFIDVLLKKGLRKIYS